MIPRGRAEVRGRARTGQGRTRAHEVLSVPSRVALLDRLRASAEPLDAEVVCAAHRGLLRAAVARLDPEAPVPDLDPFVRPGLCVIAGLRAARLRKVSETDAFACAVTFTWFGMVVAISFVKTGTELK